MIVEDFRSVLYILLYYIITQHILQWVVLFFCSRIKQRKKKQYTMVAGN